MEDSTFVFPGIAVVSCPQITERVKSGKTGVTVESLTGKRKRAPFTEEAKKSTGQMRVNDDADEAGLTVEADSADVGQQLLAVDVGHARAEARVSGAELAVHVVQSVGHGVHGVHHKLNLPLLLVGGVTAHFLQPWNRNRKVVW